MGRIGWPTAPTARCRKQCKLSKLIQFLTFRTLIKPSLKNSLIDRDGSPLADKRSPSLLVIPGELRIMIYKFLLLETEIIYPFDYRPCSCDCPKHKRSPPNVAILRVNRQINEEATTILYSGVTAQITTGYFFMKFMTSGDLCMYGYPTANSFFPSRHLIQSLRIKFVPENIPSDVRSAHILGCWSDDSFRALSREGRATAIHEYNRELCEIVWTNAGKVVSQMAGLESLFLDFEHSFCPLGCCRMAEHVVGALQGIRTKANFSLAVTGELHSEELKTIMDGLSYREDEVASEIQSIDLQEDEREEEDSSEDDSEEDFDDYSESSSIDDSENDEVESGHEEDSLSADDRDSDNEGAVSDLSDLSMRSDEWE